ncbi:MAG: tol-pal system protein YbgF, partial [Gammaproteobacteria bacterium]|nr:tol-pal system protein YbgF [Gammaproteobacteria bacterium]
MFKRFIVLSIIFVVSSSVFAVEKDVISMMSVKQRLERMERMMGSELLMQQAQQIEALQEEISALREQLDQQGHELSTIKQRQRSLYLDMDRRINAVETAAPASGLRAPVAPPGTTQVPVSVPDNNVAVGTAPVLPAVDNNGKGDYDRAFGLLKEGRYKQAIVAFGGFLKTFPQSQYADNAQYWLGEANYAYRQYDQALSEFQRLIANYPDSSKVQGARLKIAYVYYELKNW